MINQSELTSLNQPISNEARVLYLLALRPDVNKQNGETQPLNYASIKTLLNGKTDIISLGRQINALIKELVDSGLVVNSEPKLDINSMNGKRLILPLVATEQHNYQNLHLHWQSMQADWTPNLKLFAELATMVGIIEHSFSDEERGEFISYWLSRPESSFTLFQWTQKFVQHIKKKRLAFGSQTVKRVGNQMVSNKASVSADDNAKKLVEKYSGKHKR
ncbi:DnaT-like ssDNA-binding domain-containing protein [Neptunicella marina]|uniref:Flavodoxin n=1 Tax=Neptunicella marina TaxID=2125989 RepID=A0A8J6IW79_9ALTE|nr:DnaT-like ssDNA-binding domain-containing protein [Neptunicella marina]MBC3766646.1 flavodoxin [Neptunicella marina]